MSFPNRGSVRADVSLRDEKDANGRQDHALARWNGREQEERRELQGESKNGYGRGFTAKGEFGLSILED